MKKHWKKSSEKDLIIPCVTVKRSGMINMTCEFWIPSQKICFSLVNRLRATADTFCPLGIIKATKDVTGKFHEKEFLLIASAILVVKAETEKKHSC